MAATSESFLEALSEQLDYWTEAIATSLTESGDTSWVQHQAELVRLRGASNRSSEEFDPRPLIREWLVGVFHSVLTVIDEGSPRQELPPLQIGADGAEFSPGLHERFMEHLVDSGRIPSPEDDWLRDALARSTASDLPKSQADSSDEDPV